MKPRRLVWILLLLLPGLAGAEPPLGATVEGLLAYARDRNPEFAAMRE